MNRISQLDESSRSFVVKHTFVEVLDPQPGRMRNRTASCPEVSSMASYGVNTLDFFEKIDEGQTSISHPSEADTCETRSEEDAALRLPCYTHIQDSSSEQEEAISAQRPDAAYTHSDCHPLVTLPAVPKSRAEEMERLAAENARLAFENEQLRKQCVGAQQPTGRQQPSGGTVVESSETTQIAPQPVFLNNGQWCFQMGNSFMVPLSDMVFIPPAGQAMTSDENCNTGMVGFQPQGMNSVVMQQVDVTSRETRAPRGAQIEARTTVMLRNLPNNYSRSMFLGMLESEGFAGTYDFVYLPIDFSSRACLGYAFVNLKDAAIVPSFWRKFDGYSKWVLPSRKVCSVSWSGPHQGLEAHVERYRNSPVMHSSVPDEFKPVVFRDGTRVPFPTATKANRPPRIRNSAKTGCHGSHTAFSGPGLADGAARNHGSAGGGMVPARAYGGHAMFKNAAP